MKLATLSIGNNLIEAHNNMWTGVETVFFNGQKVSEQFNWFHGIHKFSVPAEDGMADDHYQVDFRIDFTKSSAVSVDMYKNGECILDQSGTNYRYSKRIGHGHRDVLPRAERLELRQLENVPLYREEDLV